MRLFRICLSIAALCSPLTAAEPEEKPALLYVATYSPNDGDGIFVGTWNSQAGRVDNLRPTGNLRSPAALAAHPTRNFLYATSVLTDAAGQLVGAVVAFTVQEQAGELHEIDRRPSGGNGPCYLSLDSEGRCLLVANCGTATLACIELKSDGRFGKSSSLISHQGESRNSEGKPQAHSILAAPDNRFAIAADLGLDRLFVYQLESAQARITPAPVPGVNLAAGSGPRHLAVHPAGKFLYSMNELGNTVTACAWDAATGELRVLQEVTTLPNHYQGDSYAADIAIHPTGRTLYTSNRGHDSLATFEIELDTGLLTMLECTSSRGKFPRSITLDATGRHLVVANQKSDQISVFAVNAQTRRLEADEGRIDVAQPVCVKFLSHP